MKQHGDVGIVAVGARQTVKYMQTHGAAYRAYVIADDTEHMRASEFNAVFSKAADLLHGQLSDPSKKAVYAHCYAGINRSVSMILAYVLRYTHIDPVAAIAYIRQVNKEARGMPALTNRTFFHHLYNFPTSGHKTRWVK